MELSVTRKCKVMTACRGRYVISIEFWKQCHEHFDKLGLSDEWSQLSIGKDWDVESANIEARDLSYALNKDPANDT